METRELDPHPMDGQDFDTFASNQLKQLNEEIRKAQAAGKLVPTDQAYAFFNKRMRQLSGAME